jgi:hypothetical protein
MLASAINSCRTESSGGLCSFDVHSSLLEMTSLVFPVAYSSSTVCSALTLMRSSGCVQQAAPQEAIPPKYHRDIRFSVMLARCEDLLVYAVQEEAAGLDPFRAVCSPHWPVSLATAVQWVKRVAWLIFTHSMLDGKSLVCWTTHTCASPHLHVRMCLYVKVTSRGYSKRITIEL